MAKARPIVDGRKQCCACGEWKPVAEFHRQARSPSGLHYKCKPCNYAASRAWKSAHPEERAARYRANKRPVINRGYRLRYGIGIAEYETMLEAQHGRCLICNQLPSDGRRLAVDHDGETGEVRGLLCMNCNVALGHINHDTDLLMAAALYLITHQGNGGRDARSE